MSSLPVSRSFSRSNLGGINKPKTALVYPFLIRLHIGKTSQSRRHVYRSKTPRITASLKEVVGFALPALGFVLADPLMSLIDTACVGQVSATQLAALGPTTALFNFCFQLVSFLGVATTNLVAKNSLKPNIEVKEMGERREAASRVVSASLTLALISGLCASVFLAALGPMCLEWMGTAPELLSTGTKYLTIRSIAAPAVVLGAVASGVCLGQQDAWTPFLIISASALLNVVGDVYLVIRMGMGAEGAAVATVAAQIAATLLLLIVIWRRGRKKNNLQCIPIEWKGMPSKNILLQILTIGSALLPRTLFGMAAYLSMTVAAARLGLVATATHQIAMQCFWFLSYFAEPLSLAAQSMIARDGHDLPRVHSWSMLLLYSGAAVGLLLAGVLYIVLTKGAVLFTRDNTVLAAVASHHIVYPAVIAMFLCSAMMMFDGISIGNGSIKHLPAGNGLGLCATLCVLWFYNKSLQGVWMSLACFYCTRILWHLWYYRYMLPIPNVIFMQ